MKTIETTGKTVDEALENALKDLGVGIDDVRFEVLEEPTRRFLGFLKGNDARVKVTLIAQKSDLAKEFVDGVLKRMDLDASFESKIRDNILYVDIFGENLGLLIGRRGETLKALELLVNMVLSKGTGDIKRVALDIAGYRKRREEDLRSMAESAAIRVERFGRKVVMGAMDARDRRIIHISLQEHPRVYTCSEGDEPFRRVVVDLKGEDEGKES